MMWLPIIMLLFLVYYLSKNSSISGLSQKTNSPEELLKERYVKGEIDEATYLMMQKTIRN